VHHDLRAFPKSRIGGNLIAEFQELSRIVVHGVGQRMFLVYHSKALAEGEASTLPSMEQVLLLLLLSITLF
jgi:hypothetical protein